jgi:hypothetical protein
VFLLVPSGVDVTLICEFHIRLNLSDTGTLVYVFMIYLTFVSCATFFCGFKCEVQLLC